MAATETEEAKAEALEAGGGDGGAEEDDVEMSFPPMDEEEDMFGLGLTPRLTPSTAPTTASSASGHGSDAAEVGGLCLLGDGVPKTKGSCFCALHKKVSDNVYNQEKTRTQGRGQQWDEFRKFKKDKSPEYLNMIISATGSKAGSGKGERTKVFNVASHVHKQTCSTRVASGGKKGWKTQVGFISHCKTEFGWSSSRCFQEWEWLKDKATADEKRTTRDRVSGDDVEWLLVPVEEYVVGENAITQSDEVTLEGKRKKNPDQLDVDSMVVASQEGHSSFNSSTFSPLKAGVIERPNLLASSSGVSAAASLASPSKRSAADSGEPPARKKTKTWDQEQEVAKAIRLWQPRLDKVKVAAMAVIEKAEQLQKTVTAEEQEAVKRHLDLQQARLPVLAAWAAWPTLAAGQAPQLPEGASSSQKGADAKGADTDAKGADAEGADAKGADADGADDDDTALFAKAKAAFDFASELTRGHGNKSDEFDQKAWEDAFAAKAGEFKNLEVFSVSSPSRCGGIARAILHGYGGKQGEVTCSKKPWEFKQDLVFLMQCVLVDIGFRVSVTKFLQQGCSLPVENLSGVVPAMLMHAPLLHITATTEHELKAMLATMKQDVEAAKELVDRIRSTIQNVSKAVDGHRADAVKKEKAKDTARVVEQKKQLQAEKDALKAVRKLCKDKTSPGLLSYCGSMVTEIRKFANVKEFKEAAAQADFDIGAPYLIMDCPTLTSLAESAIAKTALATFRAQLTKSEQVKAKRKAQCPYQVPNSSQVRCALLELSPPSRITLKPDPVLSQWGCQTDMLQAGLEYACLGNLRFTAKGSREVACTHADHVLTLANALAESRAKPPIAFSERATVPDLIERVLMTEMTEAGLAAAEKCEMKAFRATVPAGSVLFTPSGFACVERGLGVEVVQGWRLHIAEGESVLQSVSTLEEKFKTYSSADKNAVLRGFAALRDVIDRPAKGDEVKEQAD